MIGRRFAAEAALVSAAFFFGATFPLVHRALHDMTPFGFLTLRFAVALVCLGPFAVAVARRTDADRRILVRVGLVSGLLLFGGFATQTVGLRTTAPATSAFLTGLYVMFTPFVEGVVQRRVPPPRVLGSAGLALVGLYLLTGARFDLGAGEWWTIVCALLFAVWIVYQGRYATQIHPVPFTSLQMATVVLVGIPVTAATGVGHLTGYAWFSIVFTGVLCSAVALCLQLWGQRRIPPARAAVILLMEPVFAGLVSWATGHPLGPVEVVGALVILGAIALAELGPGRAPRRPADARG
ncbi:MAG: DMT family transporter [Actinomycetes bacterium]